MVFHKNKRQFGLRSHRRVFVAMFLFLMLGASSITALLLAANAQLVPVKSIQMFSSHSSYNNNEPGAWKITKSAEWTDVGKARITFEIESIAKYDNTKKYDVIMVIDNSGSMDGDKIEQVKTDAIDLTNTLLSDNNNKVALITFNTSAEILSGFSNDKQHITDLINGLDITGSTNYYDGLLKAEDVLNGYAKQDSRELVLLFLTDGFPNEETPNEVAQYHLLKDMYPYMVMNGIQYEMGDEILQPIIDISDYQYIADMSSLNNVLFQATVTPYFYETFSISDTINNDYWNIDGLDSITASVGVVSLSYADGAPIINWNMDGVYRSGKNEYLTIDIILKDEYIDVDDLLLPTNKGEVASSKIKDGPDEYLASNSTPILLDNYSVSYDANAPASCSVTGEIPSTEKHTIFTHVELSNSKLSCDGYVFAGWDFATPDVKRINDDFFIMPGTDVLIRAAWKKLYISKTMDGTVHTRASTWLDTGKNINIKMKKLSGQSNPTDNTKNTTITAIRKSEALPAYIDINDNTHIISKANYLPVYAWYDNGIIYYYSDADTIRMNNESSMMFKYLEALTDISTIGEWDASSVLSLSETFYGDKQLVDISTLSNWKTSYLSSLNRTFSATAIENIDALIDWNTSKVTTMAYIFSSAKQLQNLNGARKWDVRKVGRMEYAFYETSSLTDISALSNWTTSSFSYMLYTFNRANKLTNLEPLRNWDTSKVTCMWGTFYNMLSLVDASAISNWNTSSVTDMRDMFAYSSSLSNLGDVVNWDTKNVTHMENMFKNVSGLTNLNALRALNVSNVNNMSYMFSSMKNLTDISGISGWNVGNVTNMSNMFSLTDQLTSLTGLSGWNTSNVTNMSDMFYRSALTDISALSGWNVGSVTNMSGLFRNNKSLTNISALSGWNVGSVSNASSIFEGMSVLTDISPLREWSTSSFTDMSNMFNSTSLLEDIGPLSGWSTKNVTNMSGLFQSSGIKNVNALSGWNVSSVTDMSNMFWNSKKLETVSGLSTWITTSLTTTRNMFNGANVLSDISALANWDMSGVTTMASMFGYDYALTDINALENWQTDSLTDISSMFVYASGITSLSALENWNVSNITNMSNAFNGIPATVTRPTWYQ